MSSGPRRAAKAAAVALALLLAAAAVATHRAAGLLPTIVVVGFVIIVVLVAVVYISRRELRRARDGRRLAERALDAVPQPLFVLDQTRPGTSSVYVNAAYASLTGFGRTETAADGLDPRALLAGDADAFAVPNGAEPHSALVDVRRRDGTKFPANLELRAVPGDAGGRYVVGTLDAVSAAERTADREPPPDREPPAADAAPPSSAAALGRPTQAFLSWLTHELRSPLNACVMWLDVLALGPQPDKLPKAVEAIKRGLARQAKLVSDLSDAAKVAAGGFEMRSERLDLIALLTTGAGAWQLLAIGKQLKLEQRIELATAPIDGDGERLLQALGHVVESAIGSTPPNGRVGLRVYGDGGVCIVEVVDTGPPLPAGDEARLFAPLERAPETAKGRSGLGLGLATAYYVAARHGGSLTASSDAKGTRFVMTLPLAPGG